ncbi:YhgE/Pip domain-containing protein [Muricaecibacterium torontonense]|uniref:YhgE/Pip domain-containing protein n=1 Tax=Muricaecibacterium torontonense TaxID=3032871 RepID=UPI001430EB07|nr:YhgE/Pip domain-containing protein [Muricaecibacterium torontonense]
MHTVFAIFKRDLLRILKNPVAIVITIGVAIIPAAYAWLNILANWDPYANTSTMPVAVANQDAGASVDFADKGATAINVGAQVEAQLKDNHKLGWTFVDADEAKAGVESGRYYAALVIPEDFSKDLASVLTGNITRPELEYYVNEKLSAVAPKVTDSGASTVESSIDDSFVETVTTAVVEAAKTEGLTLENRTSSGTDATRQKVLDARDQIASISQLLKDTQSSCQTAKDTIVEAKATTSQLKTSGENAHANLEHALGSLETTRTKTNALAQKLDSSLVNGATTISGISSEAASNTAAIHGTLSSANGTLSSVATRLQSTKDSLSAAKTSLDNAVAALPDTGSIADLKSRLKAESQRLGQQLSAQQALLDKVKTALDAAQTSTNETNDAAQSINNEVQSTANNLLSTRQALADEALPHLTSALDSFSSAGNGLAGTLGSLDSLLDQAQVSLDSLASTLDQASTALGSTQTSLDNALESLDNLATDLSAIDSSQVMEALRTYTGANTDQISSFMSSPVTIDEKTVYPVANYGTGVTPFYTDVALFVGGFVLVSIYKLEVDREQVGDFKPWQAYFGRWMLLNLVGILQALITCIGDIALGIQCVHPVAFVFAGLVESFVYVNMIYALAVALKHVGKALAVVILILQIPGSSGLYPIQMQPGFFQALYPWLPFTYGNNAMREAIAGFYGSYYVESLCILLLYVIPSLIIGVALRRHLLNINRLFDAKLRETDLMACEETEPPQANFRLTTLLKAALDSAAYRQVFEMRMAWFNTHYETMVRWGFRALLLCSTVLLIPLFIATQEIKFAVLILWIVSILLLILYLVTIEYIHDMAAQKMGLSELSQSQIMAMVSDRLNHEVAPFAPFSAMRKLDESHDKAKERLESLINHKTDEAAGPAPEERPKSKDRDAKGGDE